MDGDTGWQVLRELAQSADPAEGIPALEIRSTDGMPSAFMALITWFDSDAERRAVRLVLDGEDMGVVGRDDLLERLEPEYRSGLGSGDGLSLMGLPTDFRLFEFRCPDAECAHRKSLVHFDSRYPPQCSEHKREMVRDVSP